MTVREFITRSWRLAFDLRSWRAGLRAARLPSLVIAAASCGLGIVLAYRDGRGDLLNAIAVMVAGLALQAGVNLVNDFFEFRQRKVDDKVAHLGFDRADRGLLEVLIFLVGLAFFGVAGLVGLFLAWRTGWALLGLGAVGFVGGFFYTGEPLNYKRRGLAVLLVFFLMGILMVAGSAWAVGKVVSVTIVLQSIPVSILVSLILLGNELRDYEADVRFGIRTLTVRVGYRAGVRLYAALFAAAYAAAVVLHLVGLFPHLRLLPLALPFVVPPLLLTRRPPERRGPLIPLVMLHHLAFGALFCLTYFIPK
jgi:1,4-dihydroxy-2-naphthoate polyprenyltransferase